MRPHLEALRADVERAMTAAGQVLEPGGEVFNPDTGQYEPGPATVHYQGRMLVRPTPTRSRVVEAGGQAVTLRTYDVWLPADTPAAVNGPNGPWYVKVTTCPDDPALTTATLTVLDAPRDAWQVARRLVCRTQEA